MLQLAYKKYGNQPENLIILHGLFGMMDNWHTLATAFGNSYTTWILHLCNHGRSPHSNDFNFDVMASDIADFMEQQQIPDTNVIGHSLGGKVAMQFSFNNPEKVKKLIIVDIAPRGYDAAHNELIDALQGLDLTKVFRRTDAEAMLSGKIAEPAVMQFLLKNLTRKGEGYQWKMNLEGIIRNYKNVIGPVNPEGVFEKPTLFIRGEKSDYITDKDESQIKKQFPNSQIATIVEAGHWVHADAPRKFLDVALEFLKGYILC